MLLQEFFRESRFLNLGGRLGGRIGAAFSESRLLLVPARLDARIERSEEQSLIFGKKRYLKKSPSIFQRLLQSSYILRFMQGNSFFYGISMAVLLLFPVFPLLPHPTLLLLLLTACLLGSFLLRMLCGKEKLQIRFFDAAVGVYGLFVLCAGLASAGGRQSFFYALLSFLLVCSYFPFRQILRDRIRRDRILLGSQIGGLLCSVLGIWQYLFDDLPLLWVDVNRFSDLGGRVTSSFTNPNILSVYLLFLLPQALSACLGVGVTLPKRIFFGICFALEVICLVLTFTRGAWLGALLGIGISLLLLSRKTRGCFLLLLPLVILGFPLLPSNVLHRFSSISSVVDSSNRYRLYTWRGMLRMILEHPFGIGGGERAFVSVFPHYAVSGTEGVMHAHQILLQICAELGILGFFCFLLLMLLLVCRACRGARFWDGEARASAVGAAGALIGMLTMGLFDHIWYYAGMLLLFWFCIAMLQAVPIEEREEAAL